MTDNYFALSRDFETASSTSSRSIQSVHVSLDRLSVNSKSEKSENSIPKVHTFSSKKSPSFDPVVLEGLSDKNCQVGDYVTLECRISGGNSEPTWRFEGSKELPNGTVARTLGEIYRLRIRGLQPEQFGDYSITVKNDTGSVTNTCRIINISESSKNLTINTQPTVLLEKSENIMSPLPNKGRQRNQDLEAEPRKPVWEPLTVLEPLKDQKITEGEDIVLTARIVGNPEPVVRFFYEDERFVSCITNGIKIEQDGDHFRLTLEEASTDDSGEYSIVARNDLGEEVSSTCCVLVIQRPPQAEVMFL